MSKHTIRCTVVGLGHIAQVAVLPAFAHARRNSELTAVVSADRTKRRETAKRYRLDPDRAYEYADALEYAPTVDGKTKRKIVPRRDQFAPELLYFSDCILLDREPEPSGPVTIRPFRKSVRPTGRQRITRPGIKKPALIRVQSASQD